MRAPSEPARRGLWLALNVAADEANIGLPEHLKHEIDEAIEWLRRESTKGRLKNSHNENLLSAAIWRGNN